MDEDSLKIQLFKKFVLKCKMVDNFVFKYQAHGNFDRSLCLKRHSSHSILHEIVGQWHNCCEQHRPTCVDICMITQFWTIFQNSPNSPSKTALKFPKSMPDTFNFVLAFCSPLLESDAQNFLFGCTLLLTFKRIF